MCLTVSLRNFFFICVFSSLVVFSSTKNFFISVFSSFVFFSSFLFFLHLYFFFICVFSSFVVFSLFVFFSSSFAVLTNVPIHTAYLFNTYSNS